MGRGLPSHRVSSSAGGGGGGGLTGGAGSGVAGAVAYWIDPTTIGGDLVGLTDGAGNFTGFVTLSFGTTPAAAEGTIRLEQNGSIYHRNTLDTLDQRLIGVDAAGFLRIGEENPNGVTTLQAQAQSILALRIAGLTKFQVTASQALFIVNDLAFGAGITRLRTTGATTGLQVSNTELIMELFVRLAVGGGSRELAMTGNIILSEADAHFQRLDPNGADRDVTLPPEFAGRFFLAFNIGVGNDLTLRDDLGGAIVGVSPAQLVLVMSTATTWHVYGPINIP